MNDEHKLCSVTLSLAFFILHSLRFPLTSLFTLVVSLMLVLTTVDRVVAAWLPSLHKRVAGSSRLAWICYFTTCLLMTLVCGPLIPIHDVLFGMCLPANMDAMTEDEGCRNTFRNLFWLKSVAIDSGYDVTFLKIQPVITRKLNSLAVSDDHFHSKK